MGAFSSHQTSLFNPIQKASHAPRFNLVLAADASAEAPAKLFGEVFKAYCGPGFEKTAVTVLSSERGLHALALGAVPLHTLLHPQLQGVDLRQEPSPIGKIVRQLFEDFRHGYTEAREVLPLVPIGTSFQLKVWKHLLQLPFGHTTTYGALAKTLAVKNGQRAVGTAVGKNPIALLIPCHRIIGSDGSLRGFRWGKDLKRALLQHERSLAEG